MSHYTVLHTQITDAETLVAALADLGFADVEVYEARKGDRDDVLASKHPVLWLNVGVSRQRCPKQRMRHDKTMTVLFEYESIHSSPFLIRQNLTISPQQQPAKWQPIR